MGKKIYLAGFDVFRPDAVDFGHRCRELCARYGMEGLYPLDNAAMEPGDIFAGNLLMIDRCDYVAARLDPFRGVEPDSGTCFELGYAHAKGKRIYGYLENDAPLRDRLGEVDAEGFAVEDFGFPVNLMLAIPTRLVRGSLEDCLKQIWEDMGRIH